MEALDKKSLWDSVLAELQLSVSGAIFQTWFRGKTSLLSAESGQVEIGCANSYNKVWLEERYLGQIKEILDRLTGRSNAIIFSVSSQIDPAPKRQKKTTSTPTTPLFESEAESEIKEALISANINQKYSLSNFIVGSSNQLAYAVAKSIIESGLDNYNPLLIYGGVGVGKTHLLQAIGQACLLRRSGLKALYCSSETFTSDLVESIQRKQTFDFREKYRNLDLLVVDDIQFIAGRESTQEQFFHTLNQTVLRGKQVVVSCDRNPKDLNNLQARLKSRFAGGMVASIDPPDQELREAVLLSKARSEGLDLEFGLVRELAKRLSPSIREVEGGLLRLAAVSRLTGRKIDTDLIDEIIGAEAKPPVTAQSVVDATARFFSLSTPNLISSRRGRQLVLPRQIAMHLIRSNLGLSYNQVAGYFGGKDHSTVVYSVGRVKNLLKTDSEVRRVVGDLENKIFGG